MNSSRHFAKPTFLSAACLCLALMNSGCASIMNGGARSVTMNSSPMGATIQITTEEGSPVHSGKTPMTVALDPKRGFFRGQSYVVRISMDGYRPAMVSVRPELSGWYLGNLIFGGLLGLLIIDPATGAMWNLSPSKIDQGLLQQQAQVIKEVSGFQIVLLADTTMEQRSRMQRIN